MGTEYELYYASSVCNLKEYEDNSIISESTRKEEGVAITAFSENDVGRLFCTSFDNECVQKGMEYAEYWSKVAGIPSGYKLNSKCNNKVSKFAIDPTPQEISIWEKIGELLEESSRCMIKRAKIQTMSSSIRIINSAGFDCEYASRFAYLNCLLDIHNKLYSYNAIAHNIEELLQIFMCPALIALRIKCKQELCLYPTGEYTVVLSSVALSNIISAFTGIFIGKDAQKREQLLAELRLDAGLLSICDNGLCPDGYAFAGRAAE